MKIAKKVISLFAVCAVASSAVAFMANADGIVVSPPSRKVFETDQKAVIFFEDGMENLILSISFQGDAGDFAWIVPTPAKPEVEKSTDALFTRLDELTKPEYPEPARDLPLLQGGFSGDNAEKGVTVIETKKIDYYDISVLEASDNQSLYNWLNDHGYRFAQAGNYIIDEYIQKGWYFTAVKIDSDRQNLAQGQMSSGHATPLKLSFATDQIVYPLKISSLSGVEDNAPDGQITYVDGADSKAAKLDSDRILATDKVLTGFAAENGKISFGLKKRSSDPVHKIVGVRSTNNSGTEYDSVIITNNRNNVFQITIVKDSYEQYQVDLGSDFKENEWQKFDFSWKKSAAGKGFDVTFMIDGAERTLNRTMTSNNYAKASTELPRVVVGGNYFEAQTGYADGLGASDRSAVRRVPNIYIDRTADLLLDNLKINSNGKNVFSANFDDNLDISLDGSNEVMRIFSKTIYNNNTYPQMDSMGVLLYIFAEKKYDIAGFDQQYAGGIDKESIENIAKLDGKIPWISPKKNKYFLTRHYRYMTTSEMSEDLYPTESEDQSLYNFVGNDETKMIWVFVLIGLSLVSLGSMVGFVLKNEKKKNLPVKAMPHELKKIENKKRK
ncbi:MAG: DUF2330 domain-containing protein [Patescibacteria group bacterium]|nr:DUF2330 domain-containing protein [Patescibacteria group bacterium]